MILQLATISHVPQCCEQNNWIFNHEGILVIETMAQAFNRDTVKCWLFSCVQYMNGEWYCEPIYERWMVLWADIWMMNGIVSRYMNDEWYCEPIYERWMVLWADIWTVNGIVSRYMNGEWYCEPIYEWWGIVSQETEKCQLILKCLITKLRRFWTVWYMKGNLHLFKRHRTSEKLRYSYIRVFDIKQFDISEFI